MQLVSRLCGKLTDVSKLSEESQMRIETEGDKRSAPHLQQEEREFARCLAEWRLRREMPADMEPSHRITRGRGVNS